MNGTNGNEPGYPENALVPYPVIVAATKGNPDAMKIVLQHFSGYIKTVEQMSKISGIGENKLRELMDNGELEYIQNGNRRLIADAAIWDWYQRAKIAAKPPAAQEG